MGGSALVLSEISWEAIVGITTLVQACVVVIAAFVAIRALAENRKHRALSAFIPLYEDLNSAEAVRLRQTVYNLSEISPAELLQEQSEAINQLVNKLDFLGFLIVGGFVQRDMAISLYYGTVIRSWKACQPYVNDQRKKRGTKFAEYFELLNRECVRYTERKGIARNFNTYSSVSENKNDP